jgi:hypothetical protein
VTFDTHYRQIAHTKGLDPEEFLAEKIGAELPVDLEWIFSTFLDLSSSRGSNGYTANRLTYSEIGAWCDLAGISLDPWEVDVLRKLDTVYMKAFHAGPRRTGTQDQKP